MTRSELRQVLDQYHLSPHKQYGQHFLCDRRILEHTANAVQGTRILEIGPGPGCLTRHLMHVPDRHMVLVEKDVQFESLLRDLAPQAHLIMGDALHIRWCDYKGFGVAGNLPYNISVPLIVRFVKAAPLDSLGPAVFMIQKEVADRLRARPSTKDYGRLSVMVQTYATVEKVVDVPPSSFWPMPKVRSCVVKIVLKNPCLPISFSQLEHVVHKAFACRRKMLRHAFKEAAFWKNVSIDPKRRAETLTLEEFWTLTHAFYASQRPQH